MSSSARLAPVGIVERIETILARLPSDLLPAEDRAFLEQRALPLSELRRRRLDLRDDALRALAAHHTVQRISPPTFSFLACRSDITPLLVLRMAMPRPSSTRFTSL